MDAVKVSLSSLVDPHPENGGLHHFIDIQRSVSKGTPGFHVLLPLLVTAHASLILLPGVNWVWLFDDILSLWQSILFLSKASKASKALLSACVTDKSFPDPSLGAQWWRKHFALDSISWASIWLQILLTSGIPWSSLDSAPLFLWNHL